MESQERVADILLIDVRNLTLLDLYNSVYDVMERLGLCRTPGQCVRLVGSRCRYCRGHEIPNQTLVRGQAFWKLPLWRGGFRLRGRRARLDLTRLCKQCRAQKARGEEAHAEQEELWVHDRLDYKDYMMEQGPKPDSFLEIRSHQIYNIHMETAASPSGSTSK